MKYSADFFANAQVALERVVRAARPEILAQYGQVEPDIKEDLTPVTQLDKQLERQIRSALTELDETIPIVGEELGGDGSAETFWLIDPIDGTESFVRGLPFVRNIVTLVVDNQPLFVFIYKPVTDELYIAIKGKGATKNGQPISIGKRPLSRAWIDVSLPNNDRDIELLRQLGPLINGYRRIGDFTLVAEGKIDGALLLNSGGGLWDYAPRGLLLAEAGAKVVNVGSDNYDFRNFNFIATNPVIFNEIQKIIKKEYAA